jgi:dienelactone hydrolase
MASATPEEQFEAAQVFYGKNRELLTAHERAAAVLIRHGVRVSARFLTEFSRWARQIGPEAIREIADCYDGVHVKKADEHHAVANASSAWLTRYLYRRFKGCPGFEITVRHSKIDEVIKPD